MKRYIVPSGEFKGQIFDARKIRRRLRKSIKKLRNIGSFELAHKVGIIGARYIKTGCKLV